MEIIAVANQKGGCGKTTTAINLAACLGNRSKRVLLIDMDPQGHASLGLGQACEEREGLYEVFLREVTLQEVVIPDVASGVDLVPGTISLAAVEHLLADTPEREWRLASHLASVSGNYDYGVIDCPPSLGLLAFNALRAADRVVVPVDLSVFSLDGVARLNETIDLLAEKYNTTVQITIVPTMVDYRPRFSRDILRELRGLFPGMMSQAVIHSTVRLKEAAYRGVPVIHHAVDSMGAMDYDRLAREVMGEKVGRITVSHFHTTSSGSAEKAPAAQARKPEAEKAEPVAAASAEPVSRLSEAVSAAAGGVRYERVETEPEDRVQREGEAPRATSDNVSRFVRETLDLQGAEAAAGEMEEAEVGGMPADLAQEIDSEIGVFLGAQVDDGPEPEADAEDAADDDLGISAAGETEEASAKEGAAASPYVGVSGFSMLNDDDRDRLLATFGDGSMPSSPAADAKEEDGDDEVATQTAGFRVLESIEADAEADEESLAADAEAGDGELLDSDEGDEDEETLAAAEEEDEDEESDLLAAESDEEGDEVLAAELHAEDDEDAADPVVAISANAFDRSVRSATGLGRSILVHRSEVEPSEHEVTLLFKGMSGKRVQLAGDFNGWIPDRGVTTRIQDGTLIKTMKLESGEYQYRVVVDGIWQEDPGNPERVANIYGGSNSLLRVEGVRPAI